MFEYAEEEGSNNIIVTKKFNLKVLPLLSDGMGNKTNETCFRNDRRNDVGKFSYENLIFCFAELAKR